ncbi:2249_t:CDS:10 [Acaulospora colombiana]|uniref:2249_t:CDS:1 n=1 Tax=Acaulospora colombiana TaxID=27376 RepID=A0ACA9KID8_9GLOM|nr:2249_t:CDS:10 [Acaulospora colombiana]
MSSNTSAHITNVPSNFEVSSDETYAIFSIPIEKSANDDREYRLIRLANDLEALLIRDPKTDKSAAAMDVHIGQIHDPDDGWRRYQLERSLSNPDHPFSQFGIGNLESLKEIPLKAGLDIREELIKHHKKYYSSNLMKLAVLGRESLDQLSNWVVEKFTEVENKSIPIPIPDGYPITDKELGWANTMSSYSVHQSVGFEVLKISIDLTEEGLAHYEEVVEICFQYINMLKEVDPKEQESVFKEIQSVEEIDFRFLEKSYPSYYVSEVSNYMQRPYPREWILSGPYLTRKYDSKLIAEGLEYLSWDKCVLTLSSKLLSGFDKKERWFGTEYKFEPINDRLLKSLQSLTLNPELEVHPANEFIPTNLDVEKLENVTPLEHPRIIRKTALGRIWYKKDDQFWVPKIEAHFLLKTPIAHLTPLHSVKTRLYVDLDGGIGVSVVGYNDKATLLLEKILEKMKNFTVEPERFSKIKEELKRVYQNRLLDSPSTLSRYHKTYILKQKMWTYQEKLLMLEQINYEDIQKFYPRLYERMFFEGLIHGNMSKPEAINMIDVIERILESKELLPSQLISDRTILLPIGKRYVFSTEVFDKKEINSAINYSVQVGDKIDQELRIRLDLVGQIADEPCFDQLRTKEQLGYSVYCATKEMTSTMEFRVVIQSEKDTVYLEKRIEAFLDKLQEIIENLSEEEYQKHVNSLIEKKLEKNKNLSDECQKYWCIICSGYYEFNKIEVDTKGLRELKKPELLKFYNTYIHPKSPSQKKISIHMKSQNLELIKMYNNIDIKKLHEYISSQGFPSITVEELQSAIDLLKAQDAGLDRSKFEVFVKRFFLSKIGSEAEDKMLDGVVINIVDLIFGSMGAVNGENPVKGIDKDIRKNEEIECELSEQNEIIDDVILFKTKMELSSAPYPLLSLASFMHEN